MLFTQKLVEWLGDVYCGQEVHVTPDGNDSHAEYFLVTIGANLKEEYKVILEPERYGDIEWRKVGSEDWEFAETLA